MAESVKVETGIYGTRYLGCGTALAQAGIVRSEQLPGVAGPRKRSAVYYDGRPASRGRSYPRDERYMEIKLVGRDRFSVWVPCSKAQREQHEEGVAQAVAQAQQNRVEQEQAMADLAHLPCSREAYRATVLSSVDSFLGCALFIATATDKHGYSFDFDTLQEVKTATARLRAALQGGGVVFDAARHARAVNELREQAGLPPEQPRLRLVVGSMGC